MSGASRGADAMPRGVSVPLITLDSVPAGRGARVTEQSTPTWRQEIETWTTTTLQGPGLTVGRWSAVSACLSRPAGRVFIASLPSESYFFLRPIPVVIEQPGPGEFLARFEEANIAMSGETPEDARESLLANILDVFELFTDEETKLGPEPARQLWVLRKYLARRP